MVVSKPRVIKDYEKLDASIQEQIKLAYPLGFDEYLVSFTNRDGNKVSALPFDGEDKHYLVRMTVAEARQLIEDDTDYDDAGVLRTDVKDELEEKHADLDEAEDIADEMTEEDY